MGPHCPLCPAPRPCLFLALLPAWGSLTAQALSLSGFLRTAILGTGTQTFGWKRTSQGPGSRPAEGRAGSSKQRQPPPASSRPGHTAPGAAVWKSPHCPRFRFQRTRLKEARPDCLFVLKARGGSGQLAFSAPEEGCAQARKPDRLLHVCFSDTLETARLGENSSHVLGPAFPGTCPATAVSTLPRSARCPPRGLMWCVKGKTQSSPSGGLVHGSRGGWAFEWTRDSHDASVVTPPEVIAASLGFPVPGQGCVSVCSCWRSCSFSAWWEGNYGGGGEAGVEHGSRLL